MMGVPGPSGEAWTDWLAGYQRVYPPFPPTGVVEQSQRCGLKPPADSICPRLASPHGADPGCECVVFVTKRGHAKHRALCGLEWGA